MSRVTAWVIVVTLSAAAPAQAQPRDVGAMITEIKLGRGRVEVSGPGPAAWRPAGPLLALKVGDSVRATENAAAVVVLAGRRGSVQVNAARSPFVVTAPPADSKAQKAFALLESSLGFFGSGASRETPRPVLSTRSVGRPPVILSPRAGPVMPDALTFEWRGHQLGRYTLRVVTGSTVLLERSGLTGSRLAYPADAPALTPGIPYTLQLFSGQSVVDETRFEVAGRARADELHRDLREVDEALGPDVPASSRAVMQAGLLASRGFLHDARRMVVAALTADADQPGLHALLGELYARTGLPREADEAYEEARDLASPAAR